MIAVVAVVPVVRALWVWAASSPQLAAPDAASVAVVGVACVWAAALVVGRRRGPALRPLVVAGALGASAQPRWRAFGPPFVRAASTITALATVGAGAAGVGLVTQGVIGGTGALLVALTGGLVGMIAASAWLIGQACERLATPLALAVALLGAVTTAVPGIRAHVLAGWGGLAASPDASAPGLLWMSVLAAALLAATPVLLDRIRLGDLIRQAAQWESATASVIGLDAGAVAALYRARAQGGRRLPVVGGANVTWTFVRRDALGALRTPGRLMGGFAALLAAGVLIAGAIASELPAWPFGVAAGVLAFAGLGAVTDGVRHAASVAADLPLYGLSDERVLAQHVLLPLGVALVLVTGIACLTAVILSIPIVSAATAALVLAPLAVLARVVSALKGALPPALLTPVSTPAGDPMAAIRVLWSVDAIVFAALAGIAAALVPSAPLVAAIAAGGLVVVLVARWRRRR